MSYWTRIPSLSTASVKNPFSPSRIQLRCRSPRAPVRWDSERRSRRAMVVVAPKMSSASPAATKAVAEWEQWTGMSFPEIGDYWFPGGLGR